MIKFGTVIQLRPRPKMNRLKKLDNFYIYQPGNGTRYTFTLSKITNIELAKELGIFVGGFLFQWGPNHRDYTNYAFQPEGDLFLSYVAEKLNLRHVDAEAIIEILSELTGRAISC